MARARAPSHVLFPPRRLPWLVRLADPLPEQKRGAGAQPIPPRAAGADQGPALIVRQQRGHSVRPAAVVGRPDRSEPQPVVGQEDVELGVEQAAEECATEAESQVRREQAGAGHPEGAALKIEQGERQSEAAELLPAREGVPGLRHPAGR